MVSVIDPIGTSFVWFVRVRRRDGCVAVNLLQYVAVNYMIHWALGMGLTYTPWVPSLWESLRDRRVRGNESHLGEDESKRRLAEGY